MEQGKSSINASKYSPKAKKPESTTRKPAQKPTLKHGMKAGEPFGMKIKKLRMGAKIM